MSRLSAPATPAPADHNDGSVLVFEDAPEFPETQESAPRMPEQDVDSQFRAAKEHLQQLRQQQEEIERQAQQLEELKKKQECFVAGKRDMSERLTRSLSNIELSLEETRRQLECLTITRDNFSQHLDLIKGLQPEKWQPGRTDEELDRALSMIEDAFEDYERGMRRIGQTKKPSKTPIPAISSEDVTDDPQERAVARDWMPANADDIGTWLKRGFAFTLPLIASLLLGLILAKLMF